MASRMLLTVFVLLSEVDTDVGILLTAFVLLNKVDTDVIWMLLTDVVLLSKEDLVYNHRMDKPTGHVLKKILYVTVSCQSP